jgi:hypothetical protein
LSQSSPSTVSFRFESTATSTPSANIRCPVRFCCGQLPRARVAIQNRCHGRP